MKIAVATDVQNATDKSNSRDNNYACKQPGHLANACPKLKFLQPPVDISSMSLSPSDLDITQVGLGTMDLHRNSGAADYEAPQSFNGAIPDGKVGGGM